MTLNKDGLEAAHAAYERYGQKGDLRSQRLSDGCLSTVITAYLSALPAPDGLVEKLEAMAKWLDDGLGHEILSPKPLREAATALSAQLSPAPLEGVRLEALVYDWEYTDPKTGRWSYARTPECAERLQKQGIKLTPVYTLEAVRSAQSALSAIVGSAK